CSMIRPNRRAVSRHNGVVPSSPSQEQRRYPRSLTMLAVASLLISLPSSDRAPSGLAPDRRQRPPLRCAASGWHEALWYGGFDLNPPELGSDLDPSSMTPSAASCISETRRSLAPSMPEPCASRRTSYHRLQPRR